jgi:hypothetical protein
MHAGYACPEIPGTQGWNQPNLRFKRYSTGRTQEGSSGDVKVKTSIGYSLPSYQGTSC